jgi:hypothetical protein
MINKLKDLIGLGPGLTPWGDDFLIGFLLLFNRLGLVEHTDPKLSTLNQQILEAASGKTTQLSVSLLTCAARGQADERLIAATDGLFPGGQVTDQDLADLLSWGSSSGEAALAGMLICHSLIDKILQ